MNKPVILVSVLSVALIGALLLRHRGTTNQLHGAQTEISSLSNRLAESELKLNHQERVNLALGGNFTNRTEELTKCAGDLAKTRNDLNQSQADVRASKAEVQSALATAQQARSETGSLSNQLVELNAELKSRDVQFQAVRDRMAAEAEQRSELSQTIAALNEEKQRMSYQLTSRDLLREQLARLANQPSAPQTTNQSAGAKPNLNHPLELLPDGSMRFASPAFKPPSKF